MRAEFEDFLREDMQVFRENYPYTFSYDNPFTQDMFEAWQACQRLNDEKMHAMMETMLEMGRHNAEIAAKIKDLEQENARLRERGCLMKNAEHHDFDVPFSFGYMHHTMLHTMPRDINTVESGGAYVRDDGAFVTYSKNGSVSIDFSHLHDEE